MILLFDELKKRENAPESDALKKLRRFLDEDEPGLIRILVSNRFLLENVLTYAELREAVLTGKISADMILKWQQHYSLLVSEVLAPTWSQAAEKIGVDIMQRRPGFIFDPVSANLRNWAEKRAAALVTHCTDEARKGLRAAVKASAYANKMSVDELAQVVRPMVGLTEPQVRANQNFYNRLLESGVTQKKAAERAANYAARQHRYRAQMIARTETAAAYNHAEDEAVRQAQAAGYMGKVRKVWCTADDERTCAICGALEGSEIDLDRAFQVEIKSDIIKRVGKIPPAHPHCRCAVIYKEVTQAERMAA